MKVLIVCSGNYSYLEDELAIRRPFIYEQVEALRTKEYSIEYFFIQGKGFFGYLNSVFELRKLLKSSDIDIVHAHYGFSGIVGGLASLFLGFPLVTTFHGSDIMDKNNFYFSCLAILLSNECIFVSEKLKTKAKPFLNSKKGSVIPCGVNLDLFFPRSIEKCREELEMPLAAKKILFSSAFSNPIKNSKLAHKAVNRLGFNVDFIELKDKSRKEVALLLNPVDVLLLTSFSEGSPQIVKEAMASNCPIISTDVGDVSEVIKNTQNCYITSYKPEEISDKLNIILSRGKRSNGRNSIIRFSNSNVADRIDEVYKAIITKTK